VPSLERKLPLAISALMMVLVGTAVWVGYREVRQAALASSMEHLQEVTKQLATLSATGIARIRSNSADVASSRPVVEYARGGRAAGGSAAATALETLRQPQDSLFSVELWDSAGQRLLGVGEARTRRESTAQRNRAGVPALADTSAMGPFFSDNGRVHFWTVTPVRADGRTVGYVAQLRRVATQAGTERAIRELVGSDVSVFYANAVGTGWSTIDGRPLNAPVDLASRASTFEYERPGGRVLMHKVPIASTPFVMLLELPLANVLARPDMFLRRFALFGLVLMIVGGLLAWVISRSVTKPMAVLTSAAETIARGDYSRRASVGGNDEMGRLSRAFNTMAERVEHAHAEQQRQFEAAQAANRAKSEFLATMSHEIRTPINAMIGYADLLDLEISGPITEQQRSQLARIRTSGRHLISLVNEVLDLAKIESGAMRISRSVGKICDAADTALALSGPQAVTKALALPERCEGNRDALYLGEQQRVEQILTNLLSNAVKFTGPGGVIRVYSYTDKTGPLGRPSPHGWTCVTVEDNGVGIEAEQLDRIFEPFVQGDSGYTRTTSGTGLGLAISRRLAHLMDGELTVVSEPGKGSRFTLWLPQPGAAAYADADLAAVS
jgi:signal transduction histidine kinase